MSKVKCPKCGKRHKENLSRCPRCGFVPRSFNPLFRKMSVALAFVLAGSVLAAWVWHAIPEKLAETNPSASQGMGREAQSYQIRTLDELLSQTASLTDSWDIAEASLLCAQGLPGAENLDVSQCLRTLDEWTEHIRKEIVRCHPVFLRNPAAADHSEARYSVMMITTVLGEDMGCGYNMELVESGVMNDLRTRTFFRNSADLFIHGLLTGKRKGSCSSMPVFLVAIGRRLGFPLKLVTAKAHLFVRWEDAKERFNIECTGHGVSFHPDEYYMKWPHPITEEEVRKGLYLRSLTPQEELGTLLSLKATCLMAHAMYDKAKVAAQRSQRFYPTDREPRQILMELAGIKQKSDAVDHQQALDHAVQALRQNNQHAAANLVLGHEPTPGPAGSFGQGGR